MEPSAVENSSDGRELRWIADAYEQAQRIRVETGERIRALVQGRDQTWQTGSQTGEAADPDQLLGRIRAGETDGPVPILGRTYRRHWEEERELNKAILEYVRAHPAWPWLGRVRGVGATLACKLIARLDATRADTPSAFWAYCGLATVPGTEYRCDVCGLTRAFPVTYRLSGVHRGLADGKECSGQLRPVRGPEQGVRVAQPQPARGERSSYDRYAKKVCYQVGVSFLEAGGAYEAYYRRERAKLDHARPGWAAGRKHFAALRKTEKLFLAHLWLVWREALGLTVTEPYPSAVQGHDGHIDPWSMVE